MNKLQQSNQDQQQPQQQQQQQNDQNGIYFVPFNPLPLKQPMECEEHLSTVSNSNSGDFGKIMEIEEMFDCDPGFITCNDNFEYW